VLLTYGINPLKSKVTITTYNCDENDRTMKPARAAPRRDSEQVRHIRASCQLGWRDV